MCAEKDFDVIVIGAGPAGSACAYTLAKEGKSVLVVERGDFAGAKNVTGGRVYTYALEQLEPGMSAEAKLERNVVREQILLYTGNEFVNIDYHSPTVIAEGGMSRSFTVLRSKFDRWLADKAEKMGAVLICGIRVDDLLEENGEIVGIMAGEDKIYADFIVAADGINSIMAQKAGLIGDISAQSIGVGVKEIIELSSEIINSRFKLQAKDGAAIWFLGYPEGIHGMAFLYTNLDSIALGAIYAPLDAAKSGKSVHQLFQELKIHPAIYPFIAGGKTVEYAAHLVDKDNCPGIVKKPYKGGLLVVGEAAGFVINTGYDIRGIDLAILSGISAAKAIITGEDKGKVGFAYEKELGKVLLPMMKEIKGYMESDLTKWQIDKDILRW